MAKAAKQHVVSGLELLLDPTAYPAKGVTVVAGDEPFLKHEALRAVRAGCSATPDDLDWDLFDGRTCQWRDVHDALSTPSLFGGGAPAVVVEDADAFVKLHRPQLEDYAAREHRGWLVLDVATWLGTTRLAKVVAERGLLVQCHVPDRGQELGKFTRDLKRWLQRRAQGHGVTLDDAAVEVLLDLIPLSAGVLDQEVARLALLAPPGGAIEAPLVRQHVGGWRVRKTWDMIDAAAGGDAPQALDQLHLLLLAGEEPIGLLAQVSSTLRRFAAATSLLEQAEAAGRRVPLGDVLRGSGFLPFKLAEAEGQLRQIGRARARRLDRWLLDADLALKGASSSPPRARIELERLLVRLSAQADPRRADAAS